MKEQHNTEQIIFEAARKIFIHKGFDGTRMQDIADEAGINKALLHYYFRSKEKLFDTIFQNTVKQLVPNLQGIIDRHDDIFEVVDVFVRTYYAFIKEHPFVPLFVINELNKNPKKIVSIFEQEQIPKESFFKKIMEAVDKEVIRPIDPRELIVNILSLVLFPIAARNTMAGIIFQSDNVAYDAFLDTRIDDIIIMIQDNLRKKN